MDLLLNFPEVWRWTFSVKAWLQQSKSWHWLAGILTEDTPGCPLPQLPGLHPTACLVKAFISCEWLHYIVVDRSSPASFWITTSKSLLTVSLNCHSLGVGRGMLFSKIILIPALDDASSSHSLRHGDNCEVLCWSMACNNTYVTPSGFRRIN